MSDYLYNILARSLGLIETAQPLVTSLFEPPRDFKPIDAPQTSAPAAESAPASDARGERPLPVSAASTEPDAPRPAAQTIALNSSPSLDVPVALEKAGAPPERLNPPSLPGVEQPAARLNQTPPASSQTNTPVFKRAVQPPSSVQTIRTPESAQIEFSQTVLKNPAHASQKKESIAEGKSLTRAPAREPTGHVEQRPHPQEPFARQKAVEQALSRKGAPPPSVEIHSITHQRSETVIVKPQVSRYVELQPPDSTQAPRANEATEQTVQVTIGRIEVRAAPAAPARTGAPKGNAPQPSQSLEEYLRQRARGNGSR